MHILCSLLNNALSKKFIYFDLPFKLKYLPVLNLLKTFNCINNFYVYKRYIRIFLRYFNNKPVFCLTLFSTNAYKKIIRFKKIKIISGNAAVDLYSTNKGIINFEKVF